MQVDDITVQNRFQSFKLGRSSTSSSDTSLSSKRGSHHRRNSSVSTRHESAEMMGFSLPELPASAADDAMEKDSIRKRALWALEGRCDPSTTTVELPTPESVNYDFPTRPSFPPGSGFSSMPKRDSFKILVGSGKETLDTLIEEEEEEELPTTDHKPSFSAPVSPTTPHSPRFSFPRPVSTAPSRPRPLSLRPLSLTPETLSKAGTLGSAGLPTPSPTPLSANPRSGLKTLSLLTSSIHDDSVMLQSSTALAHDSMTSAMRPALNLQISAESTPHSSTIIATSNHSCSSSGSDADELFPRAPIRRSSISYKNSSQPTVNAAGLPTPVMTPTYSERRLSEQSFGGVSNRSSISSFMDSALGSEEDFPPSKSGRHPGRGKGLSASEQHFLFKSHNALLARITDLEKALSIKRASLTPDSRPASMISDVSTTTTSSEGPSDEMLRLVADLKSERDDLKRDVDLWRVRVGDLEKQIAVLGKRLESERREAWVARSQLSLVEAERDVFKRDAEGKEDRIKDLMETKEELKKDNLKLRADLEKMMGDKDALDAEVARLRSECDKLKSASVPETPTPLTFRGFQTATGKALFTSSRSTNSDFPSDDDSISEEEDGLAGYEDEEEDDINFDTSSSFGSMIEFVQGGNTKLDLHVAAVDDTDPITPRDTVFRPAHHARSSLSKTWTFPFGAQSSAMKESDSADHFFGCLDDKDDASRSDHIYSYEKSKSLFASGFNNDADDVPPFFSNAATDSTRASSSTSSLTSSSIGSNGLLAVVEEQDDQDEDSSEQENDDEVFGEVGGIKITFTPPEEDAELLSNHTLPSPYEESDDEEEEEDSISYSPGAIARVPPVIMTPPKSLPRGSAQSAIPRAASFKTSPASSQYPTKLNSLNFGRSVSPSSNGFTTPQKRSGSFIPQPITPPRSIPRSSSTSPPAQVTFMRQPHRQPQQGSTAGRFQNPPNGSPSKPQLVNTYPTLRYSFTSRK